MKCLTKVLIGMMALSTYTESKLVVYGPQELIDSFTEKSGKTDDSKQKDGNVKTKSKYTI